MTPLHKSPRGEVLKHTDSFSKRHIGPNDRDVREMLKALGFSSLEDLVRATIPAGIRVKKPLNLPEAMSEYAVLGEMKAMSLQNKLYRNYIGMGYNPCVTPPVIQRNILENPGWYTQYTPYQSEISQGRLEALLNFQTMIIDLTGMEIANASMLDEGTAAAEAMTMAYNIKFHGKHGEGRFFVSQECHPQTVAIVQTRAAAYGIEVVVGDHEKFDFSVGNLFGALLQYPASDGALYDYSGFIEKVHGGGGLAVVAADILSLCVLKSPGEFGADVVVGNTQRFGVPVGYGVSVDADGKPALRLALQTREQHIRRAKATSNICTAQVLLGVMASMYAVYHGPEGLRAISERVHGLATLLAEGLSRLGFKIKYKSFFDTLAVEVGSAALPEIWNRAQSQRMNFRTLDEKTLGISVDETTSVGDVIDILEVFSPGRSTTQEILDLGSQGSERVAFEKTFVRVSEYLKHPVFNSHHSETKMLRYMNMLQRKDLSLTTSMIPLGSCTMKLNATAEMVPVTWNHFGQIHPFAPLEQAEGYKILTSKLESALAEITGFDAISLQPNAGSQGEYAGLLVIKKYHESRGQGHRKVCLIPNSAHGTNPASAAMAGMQIISVETESNGNISVEDLRKKAEQYKNDLSALMITYPSTHGVFEESIVEICEIVHRAGGQVYMDGANMNAQVGLCRPGDFGPDVCHLNLHKTFCIPHGGGGPGMGPIGVKQHLAAFLPSHPVISMGGKTPIGPVSAAPWGSASILPISLVYILMMGTEGLTKATQVAILNANYIAKRLDSAYPVLYKGREGMVAHECIIDLRPLKAASGIDVEDVAKRLMDYGFHAPTVSFPVPGTMMIEPTESESLDELDRFCEAMLSIRAEIEDVAAGRADRDVNVLKKAPHTAAAVLSEGWNRPYSREKAAFPAAWVRENKFWPPVSRIDNPYGDRNLMCSCPSVEEMSH